MRVAFALLVDHKTHNFMRKLAVDIHTRYQTRNQGGGRPLFLVFCDGLRNRGPRPFPASFSFKGFFRHQAVRT